MIKDIDDLLEELDKLLSSTLDDIENGKTVKVSRVVDQGSVRITSEITIRSTIGDLEPYSRKQTREPLVDVFESPEGMRVVIDLPGVRKEDVKVRFAQGALRLEVTHDGRVHSRDIPTNMPGGGVQVWSTKENNSVVELTFPGFHTRNESFDR